MTLRNILHEVRDPHTIFRQRCVILWPKANRRIAGVVQQLPELVPWAAVVVTPVGRCSGDRRSTEDNGQPWAQQILEHEPILAGGAGLVRGAYLTRAHHP